MISDASSASNGNDGGQLFEDSSMLTSQFGDRMFREAYGVKPYVFHSMPQLDPATIANMIWDILIATKFSPNGIRLAKRSELFEPSQRSIRGKSYVDPDGLIEALQLGQTVNINGVEKYRPDIRTITTGIEDVFGLPCSANLYISYEGSIGGYGPHRDPHDVVAVHLYGEKTWNVYAPDSETISLRSSELTKGDTKGKKTTYQMSSGTCLYVPAGYSHDVISQGGVCVHLTFGLKCLRWMDVLSDLLNEATDDALYERIPTDEDEILLQLNHKIESQLLRIFSHAAVSRFLERNEYYSSLRLKKDRVVKSILQARSNFDR